MCLWMGCPSMSLKELIYHNQTMLVPDRHNASTRVNGHNFNVWRILILLYMQMAVVVISVHGDACSTCCGGDTSRGSFCECSRCALCGNGYVLLLPASVLSTA